jgi:two-component system sensor histidine kinase ResE
MPSRMRGSIRLWQTGLFIVVIVVAMLVLSGTLSAGLTATLTRMAETSELRNASALVQRLTPEFPLADGGAARVKTVVADYLGIYGGGIWVYDREGALLESAHDAGPVDAVLQTARDAVLDGRASYAVSDLRSGGWVVASKPVPGPDGALEAVVVTASSVDSAVAILQATRDRLWVAFWVSLAIAGLLGLGFSELIGRRIKAMSRAAAAMAAGDFDQRISAGLVPDEIEDLAVSYNSMAATLGEAFGAIQESRRQIAAVVESMAEGVLAFDADGIVTVGNPEAMRLLGTSEGDMVGAPVEEVTSEASVLEIVRAGLDGEADARTVALQTFMVLLHCTPLMNAEGEVDGAVLVLADVTERHRIEDAQRRFVADASHEMRTPVAALKGMLELLVDGAKDVPEVRDDFMRTMQFEVDRLGRLVADLLTLAQLEAGSLRVEAAPESVVELFAAVTGVMQTLAEHAGVTLSVEVPTGDLRVLADRDRIVQVLLSFTDNALKHSPTGATVHLRARPRAGAVRFEVVDEGPGIAPEELARVFERFYRSDAARAGAGTGLGLAIAKEIVEAHGSSIEVRSGAGTASGSAAASAAGTAFSFELPVA